MALYGWSSLFDEVANFCQEMYPQERGWQVANFGSINPANSLKYILQNWTNEMTDGGSVDPLKFPQMTIYTGWR